MEVDLDGRTALVTGAGRGNGRAIARRLAANGAAVAVNDLERERAEETVQELRAEGGEAVAVSADVGDRAAVRSMVDDAVDEFGPVDVLVNNAGVGDSDKFVNGGFEEFELNIRVHIWGTIYCTYHALDGMLDAGYGKVVNVTSIHTKNGVGFSPQYDVGKFGVLGLTKSLAQELGRHGIRVNAVAPGWTNTPMTEVFTEETRQQVTDLNPLGRFAEPEEIADAVLFLASPASDYVNGHELRVDGGQVPVDRWRHEAYRFE